MPSNLTRRGKARRRAARKIQALVRGRRARRRSKAKSVIPRPLKCFPNSMKFNMRYCDVVSIPNHVLGSGPQVFRMNSIFDPDHTSVGHQPRFHDQIQSIYHKYCVIGSKAYIEILTCTQGGGSGQQNPTVFAYLDDAATADSRSLEQHIELGMPNSSYLMTNVPGYGSNTGAQLSRAKRSFTMTYGVRKFWGIDKKTQLIYPSGTGVGDEYVENSDYAAMFGTNPAKECFLKIKSFDTAGSSESIFKARITIDYTVICYQPIEVGAS